MKRRLVCLVFLAFTCALVTGCPADEPTPDAGEPTSNAADAADESANGQCDGTAPSCILCGSDVETPASCAPNGSWYCESGEINPDCPTQYCSMFGGEICCDAEGNSESAICPSPSQAYCEDGSPAVMECGNCGDGLCDPSESAAECPDECDS